MTWRLKTARIPKAKLGCPVDLVRSLLHSCGIAPCAHSFTSLPRRFDQALRA